MLVIVDTCGARRLVGLKWFKRLASCFKEVDHCCHRGMSCCVAVWCSHSLWVSKSSTVSM